MSSSLHIRLKLPIKAKRPRDNLNEVWQRHTENARKTPNEGTVQLITVETESTRSVHRIHL